jgi:hypothetical protein
VFYIVVLCYIFKLISRSGYSILLKRRKSFYMINKSENLNKALGEEKVEELERKEEREGED